MIAFAAFLGRYKIALEILLACALGLWVVREVHVFLEHERDIGRKEVQALWDKQTDADKEQARIKTAELESQKAEAEKNGASREQTIRTLAAATGSASNGLRDTLATIRGSVPGASTETLAKSVATLTIVLAECQGRYSAMAERADRHASDAKTLSDAWPTSAPERK